MAEAVRVRIHRVREGTVLLELPEELARRAGLGAEEEALVYAEQGHLVVEPASPQARALALARWGEKLGRIDPEELEEESLREQKRLLRQATEDTP